MTEQPENTRVPWNIRLKNRIQHVGSGLKKAVLWYDRKLRKIYSPNTAALTGTFIVLIIAVILLFAPPCVGVADDGSLTKIMHETGLGYRNQDLEYPVGAYFVRLLLHSDRQPGAVSSHQAVIRFAMWIDDLFTKDNLFDIRYLGAVYLILYLPAVWLLLRGIAARVKHASEATFLTILSAFVLADATILSYMNSLYPEAMWQIFLVYCFGFCLALQHEHRGWSQAGFIGLAVTGSIFAMTEMHCAAVGFVLALFCVRQIAMERGTTQTKVLAVTAAIVLFMASFVSWNASSSRFTDTSKMHAMTNGVLLRSNDPAETLVEFGIEPRFETLTDSSAYADYPYALAGNPEITRDFLDRYSPLSIAVHYLQHPFAYAGLLELGTGAAFQSSRNYVGTYEVSLGLPEKARNPLFIFYSMFKSGSLPRTIGFLLILAVIYVVMFRPKKGLQARVARWTSRERQILLDTFFCAWLCGAADLTVVLLMSGTAELERYQMIYGTCVDLMILLFVAEILHRLNILSVEE